MRILIMPDVEQLRRRREEEARKRDELAREERKRQEERERLRHKQDLDRKRWTDMARAKQEDKKAADILEAEMKSLTLRAQLGDKEAQIKLDEIKKSGQGPRPYTGQSQ
jgi:hypothetical protein